MSMEFASAIAALVTTIVAGSGQPSVRPIPDAPEDRYAVAEMFANCTAHWKFRAQVATRAGLPDNATAFEGYERGWSLAGTIILILAMDDSRAGEAEQTFDYMVEGDLNRIKASFELNRFEGINEQYESQCGPWAPTQRKIIENLRRGHAP